MQKANENEVNLAVTMSISLWNKNPEYTDIICFDMLPKQAYLKL